MAEITGIHHVKLAVSDLARSRRWYAELLGLETIHEFTEAGRVRGVALRHPGSGVILALREQEAGQGSPFTGFDPIAFSVAGRAQLEAWNARLEALRVDHSPIERASMGWTITVRDPDRIQFRLYAEEA